MYVTCIYSRYSRSEFITTLLYGGGYGMCVHVGVGVGVWVWLSVSVCLHTGCIQAIASGPPGCACILHLCDQLSVCINTSGVSLGSKSRVALSSMPVSPPRIHFGVKSSEIGF